MQFTCHAHRRSLTQPYSSHPRVPHTLVLHPSLGSLTWSTLPGGPSYCYTYSAYTAHKYSTHTYSAHTAHTYSAHQHTHTPHTSTQAGGHGSIWKGFCNGESRN